MICTAHNLLKLAKARGKPVSPLRTHTTIAVIVTLAVTRTGS
jgi:hypothetical protein